MLEICKNQRHPRAKKSLAKRGKAAANFAFAYWKPITLLNKRS
jgi:hypothetical protein